MRLDILMQYSSLAGKGSAALRWVDPFRGGEPIQATLVALLYGRILCVHAETRAELFRRVDGVSQENVRTEGAYGFEFPPWTLHLGMGAPDQTLWPWALASPSALQDPKLYSAILKSGPPAVIARTGQWIHLEMAQGLERVFAPSSALIAIDGFSASCGRESRYMLALILWQMNAYYGRPERAVVGTEAVAYGAAMEAIRAGRLTIP